MQKIRSAARTLQQIKITTQVKTLNKKKKYLKDIQEIVKSIRLLLKAYYFLNQLLESHLFLNSYHEIFDFLIFVKNIFMRWI